MQVHIRKTLALLMCLFLLPFNALAQSRQLPLQDAHRVTLTQKKNTMANGAEVYRWEIVTAQSAVTQALNELAQGYVAEVTPTLARPGKDGSSRLDVDICHSRTGLTWMSFMVQSRYVLNKVTTDVRFTTRTYDMSTRARVLLTDIFPADSAAWSMLEAAVREGVCAYYPDQEPDAAALEDACRRERIEQMDFTLHGMSLVLHLHAADFYPGKQQLIEVTLFYPELRPYMTQRAQTETDNLTYYNTIALTYDDGPNGWITREMLNVLLKTGERATFFTIGTKLSRYAQYMQRAHDEGHAVATHTYDHSYAQDLTDEQMHAQKRKVDQIHLEVLGMAPKYARAPGGIYQPMTKAKLGWPLIQWTSQGTDWAGENGREPTQVKDAVVGTADDGGIILMHDLKVNSVTASELFITRLQERGYIFLTVDELFAKDGVALQPDTVYWRCSGGVTTNER
ncbi:MAG: polysaccharide deacetylase family protein [Clostridiales bacterium]|nr:polysaccharide deacetylase family protein [Clostridiales bacterium]